MMMMMMNEALHPRDDVDRLYVLRKGGRRDSQSLRIPKRIKKNKERLITAASNSNSDLGINRKQQKLENRNGKKNNCMDTSSEKPGRLHPRKPG